jgi:hypothetical protein
MTAHDSMYVTTVVVRQTDDSSTCSMARSVARLPHKDVIYRVALEKNIKQFNHLSNSRQSAAVFAWQPHWRGRIDSPSLSTNLTATVDKQLAITAGIL